MPVTRLALTLGTLVLCIIPVAADDLGKIDRTIAKEPAYNGKPKYCLLVFGPEAKTRVWLVRDGSVLYVDRNWNGDLTETGERYTGTKLPDVVRWSIGDIVEADGTVYKNLLVSQDSRGMRVAVDVSGRGYQAAGEDMFGRLAFADRPKDAPVVHLGGSLQLSLENLPSQESPPRSYIPVIAIVGTPGEGKGTFAALNPKDMFQGAKFVCKATFATKRPGATPVQLGYDYDCY